MDGTDYDAVRMPKSSLPKAANNLCGVSSTFLFISFLFYFPTSNSYLFDARRNVEITSTGNT